MINLTGLELVYEAGETIASTADTSPLGLQNFTLMVGTNANLNDWLLNSIYFTLSDLGTPAEVGHITIEMVRSDANVS